MKQFLVIYLLLLVSLLTAYAQDTEVIQGSWQQLTDLPSEDSFVYAPFEVGLGWAHHIPTFTIGNFGYVLDWSIGPFLGLQDRMMRYDAENEEWMELENAVFPEGRKPLSYAIAYQGAGYFTHRGNDPDAQRLWRFDPEMLSWEVLSMCPCVGRSHPALVAANGKVYLGLGDAGDDFNDWWAYDIATDSWEEKPSFPGAERHHPYFFAINNDVYVGMGHGEGIYNDLYKYDTNTDEWTQMTSLPAEGRVAGTEFAYNGKGYVLSGQGEDHDYLEEAEFWEYDPEEDSWTQLESQAGTERWAPGSFLIDHTIYYFGGRYDTGNESTYILSNGDTSHAPVLHDNEFWAYTFEHEITSNENEVLRDKTISIYPNPTEAKIRIQSSVIIEKIEIVNHSGLRVFVQDDLYAKEIDLNLAPFSAGLYQCLIHSKSSIDVRKLVIH